MAAKTGTASQSKSGSSTAGKTLNKTTSSSSGGGGGLFKTVTGYNNPVDMINGGGPGRSGPTFQGHVASGVLNALGVKPMGSGSTMGGGGGADSGQAAARRDAAARYVSGAGRGDGGGGSSGTIFDTINMATGRRPRRPATPEASSASTLASIGAPTKAPAPVEIPTPTYGLPSLIVPNVAPSLNYGAAFAPMANPMAYPMTYPYINLMDIFGAYPEFLPRV